MPIRTWVVINSKRQILGEVQTDTDEPAAALLTALEKYEDTYNVISPLQAEGLPRADAPTKGTLIRCAKRHHVDHDEEKGIDRYADVGMLGVITDDQAAQSNPYEIVWQNGAWGFYTADEINRDAEIVMLEGKDFTLMMTVWVVSIRHRHGTSLYAASSEEKAREIVLDYVREWWHEVSERWHGPEEFPARPSEAISGYFERVEDEEYTIVQVQVL